MAAQTSMLHVRVDDALKEKAAQALDRVGLTLSDAVRILLTRVAAEGGMPAGLTVERQWWLDEDGKQVTIQDKISGEKQLLWRVDASPGQRLGAIKVDDGGQLVTKNPTTGNLGVELRQPTFSVQSSARAEVTPAMLEGYAGAKVLVEGLRRAGNNPSRASLQQALNGMRKVDIGGLEVSFSESDHTGLDFADLSIIGLSGKFVR